MSSLKGTPVSLPAEAQNDSGLLFKDRSPSQLPASERSGASKGSRRRRGAPWGGGPEPDALGGRVLDGWAAPSQGSGWAQAASCVLVQNRVAWRGLAWPWDATLAHSQGCQSMGRTAVLPLRGDSRQLWVLCAVCWAWWPRCPRLLACRSQAQCESSLSSQTEKCLENRRRPASC